MLNIEKLSQKDWDKYNNMSKIENKIYIKYRKNIFLLSTIFFISIVIILSIFFFNFLKTINSTINISHPNLLSIILFVIYEMGVSVIYLYIFIFLIISILIIILIIAKGFFINFKENKLPKNIKSSKAYFKEKKQIKNIFIQKKYTQKEIDWYFNIKYILIKIKLNEDVELKF